MMLYLGRAGGKEKTSVLTPKWLLELADVFHGLRNPEKFTCLKNSGWKTNDPSKLVGSRNGPKIQKKIQVTA